MRKFLTLFSALLLTVSMWGAYEYNATINGDVTLTDLTYDLSGSPVYKYQLDFAQVGQTVGTTDTWNSEVCMILEPLEEGLAGTYRKDDYSMNSDSYVKYGSETRKVCDYNSGDIHKLTEIVITDNQDGSYTISGAFRTKISKYNSSTGKSTVYYYYYYFDATDPNNTFTPVAPDPYKDEPAKDPNGIEFESSEISYYNGVLTLGDEYQYYDSYLNLEFASAGDNIAAGTYSIGTDITPGDGTSYYGTPNHSGYYDYDNYNTYFIVGGSVTISYLQDNKKMTISGTAISGHGTEITISVTGDNPFYVNPTYSREVTVGNYGTICLPRKFTEMTGVDGLFVPSYQDGGVLYCDEVALEDVQAGYAYIFKSNADEVTFTFNPEDVETAPVEANYMYGWLADDYDLSVLDLYYDYEGYALLANNQIITPTAGSVIKKNRAMINLANVPSEAPQLAPNRRRVAFGTNVATGLEKVQGNMRTGKMMIKGNLILMKDGKKFNAQGAEL